MTHQSVYSDRFRSDRPKLVRKLTLTATLAALYSLFRLIPIDRAIAIPGTITAGSVIIPIIALFLEIPFAITSVIIGTFVGALAPWNSLRFFGLDFLPGVTNVLLAGLMIRGKRAQAALTFLAVFLVFILTPYTEAFVGARLFSPPVPYYWLHLVALAVIISPLSKNLGTRLESGNYRSVSTALGVIAFTGTMLEHLTGGILSALVFQAGIVRAWPVIFVFYPVERIILTILATVVAVPIVLNTRKFQVTLGRTSLPEGE